MKLILTIEVSHDALDVGSLELTLPQAMTAITAALAAGVAATGPDGMTIQPSGVSALVKLHFRLAYQETAGRTILPLDAAS